MNLASGHFLVQMGAIGGTSVQSPLLTVVAVENKESTMQDQETEIERSPPSQFRAFHREDTVQLAASFATVAFSQKEKVLRDLLAADDRQRNEDSAAALRFVQEEASMLEHDPRVDKAI